jgi:hypothetical protein
MDGREVEQDGRQHLGGVAPQAHQRGERGPRRAGQHRREERGDGAVRRGHERRQPAHDELPFAADVPDAGAEGEDDAQPRQQQRHGLEERPLQRERRADAAADEQREQLARRVAEGGAGEGQEEDGGERGADGVRQAPHAIRPCRLTAPQIGPAAPEARPLIRPSATFSPLSGGRRATNTLSREPEFVALLPLLKGGEGGRRPDEGARLIRHRFNSLIPLTPHPP